MKIKQVEELVGITKKNIRFYEEQGLLNVARAENGYREYNLADVRRLKEIKLLRSLSIPIGEMKGLFSKDKSLHELLSRQLDILDEEKSNIEKLKFLCSEMIASSSTLESLNTDIYLNQMDRMAKEGVNFMNVQKIDIRKRKLFVTALISGILIVLFCVPLVVLAFTGLMTDVNLSENPIEALPIALFVAVPVILLTGTIMAFVGRIREIEGGEEDEASKY